MRTSAGWRRAAINLLHHIETVKKAGINPVVCINAFYTDTDNEIKAVRRPVRDAGARVALSRHWEHGGEGALEFADAVVDACEEPNDFKFLYDLDTPLSKRIELIAKEVYGADGVSYSAGGGSQAEADGGRSGNEGDGHLHGQDPPVPVP